MRARFTSKVLVVFIVLFAQLSLFPLFGADRHDSNLPQHIPFAVIELFTSEGCSSCPPADALLQKIHLKKTAEGQLILGISEHVTYWNSLGWSDPFSAQVFTERQAAYAARLSPEGPYTPQMVVNGRDQFVGSDVAALERALRANSNRPYLDLQITSLTEKQSDLSLQFSLRGQIKGSLDIIAVITDDADRSNVLRGENSGRSLQHISVARMLTRIGTVHDATEQTAHLQIPASFNLQNGSGHHLILLAQEQHQGAILGAAIMPLSRSALYSD